MLIWRILETKQEGKINRNQKESKLWLFAAGGVHLGLCVLRKKSAGGTATVSHVCAIPMSCDHLMEPQF
jgi:hypothetical protein